MAVFWFDQFSSTNSLKINPVGKAGSKRDEAVVILTSEFFWNNAEHQRKNNPEKQ